MTEGPLLVGLTGNVASGKSTVAQLLREKGAHVIDADALARDAVAPGTPALAAIAARWPGVITPDGTLNRPALRRIVFSDPTERAALEAITHPVISDLRARAHPPLIVYDVPLLFERGLEHTVDVVVLVDAPESVRRARLERDRHLSSGEAAELMASQWPSAEKRARAAHIVDNDADLAALRARVETLWSALARSESRG